MAMGTGRGVLEPDTIRGELERLLTSRTFARSKNLRRFLEFTVTRMLEGHPEDIKESSIAIEAYGRPSTHDPRLDPIVRTDALRLRKKLAAYYQEEGLHDPVRLDYPKGSYVPTFAENEGASTAPEPEASPEAERPARAPSLALVAFLLVGLAAVAAWLTRVDGEGQPARVAVHAFRDLSPEASREALALAISDTLVARLTRLPGIQVVSRGQSVHDEPTDALSAPDYVVDGTFQRIGESCRINVQLTRVADGVTAWAERYAFEWTQILQIQETVVRDVANEIGARALAGDPGIDPPARDPEAFEALSQARHALYRSVADSTPGLREQALKGLERSLELDPDYPDALIERAYYNILMYYPPRPTQRPQLAETRALLSRALRLDPEHPRGLYLMGQVESMLGHAREGLSFVLRGVELDPNDPDGQTFLALRYAEAGFYESAVTVAERAVRLRGAWVLPYRLRVHLLARLGRVREAKRAREELLAVTGPVPQDAQFEASVRLAEGDLQGALATLEGSLGSHPALPVMDAQRVLVGIARALDGDTEGARRAFDELRGEPYFWDDLAVLSLLVGTPDEAVQQIEMTPMARNYRWVATSPYVERFLGSPPFHRLLDRLYAEWQTALELAGDRLPAAPPVPPSPEELSRAPAAFPQRPPSSRPRSSSRSRPG